MGLKERLESLDTRAFGGGPVLELPEELREWWTGLEPGERQRVYDIARSGNAPRDADEARAWAAVLRARAGTLRSRTAIVRAISVIVLVAFGLLVGLALESGLHRVLAVLVAAAIGWSSASGRERAAGALERRADELDP